MFILDCWIYRATIDIITFFQFMVCALHPAFNMDMNMKFNPDIMCRWYSFYDYIFRLSCWCRTYIILNVKPEIMRMYRNWYEIYWFISGWFLLFGLVLLMMHKDYRLFICPIKYSKHFHRNTETKFLISILNSLIFYALNCQIKCKFLVLILNSNRY